VPSNVREHNGRFEARARIKGTPRHLGTFKTPEEARRAVERAREGGKVVTPAKQRTRYHAKKKPPTRVVPPTEEQVLAIADAVDARKTYHRKRRRAFVLTAAYSGLRLFETANLRAQDVRGSGAPDRGMLHVRRGKGGFPGDSLLFDPGWTALREIMPTQGLVFSDTWHYDGRRVAVWFRDAARKVGVDCTFHSLRHFHAVWLLDKGVTALDAAAQLRHRDRGQLVMARYGWFHDRQQSLARINDIV
jgi:integrase